MAKQQQQQRQAPPVPATKKVAPVLRTEKKGDSIFSKDSQEMLFGRINFIYFGIGLALVVGGLLAMTGGAMPDPNKWEPDRIYSFRRITLAPIMMVVGFVVVVLGIFKKSPTANRLTRIERQEEA
jgi:Protein of unknown function (DUF3098)